MCKDIPIVRFSAYLGAFLSDIMYICGNNTTEANNNSIHMKRHLIYFCLLFISSVVSSQTTVQDSLKSLLQRTANEHSRLEILTNLMDISRNDDILTNAKILYNEALKSNDNYHIEAALTEILRYYINTDQTDSANVYLSKAEKELKGEARTSLTSFMKMIQDTRIIFYTSGEPRKKVLQDCLYKLDEPDQLNPYERIACNYILGMAVSNSIMEESMSKENFLQGKEYFDNVLADAEKLPIRYAYNYLPNTYLMQCAYASSELERGQYATRYLNTILKYANIPEMKKRPYATNKRHLLSAYSNLAISAKAIGKDMATSYYHAFLNLLATYPESASAAPEYERYYTGSNYYLSINDYKKFIEYSDSLIDFSNQIPLYKEHVIAYVSAKAAAYDSLGMYKEAYESSKEYAVLLDTLRSQELRKKMENLEIQKGVDKLLIEKKSLELKLQESKKENYLYISLLLLALCAVFYIFFRLGKVRSLYQELQRSNHQVLVANRKAQESEEMKTAFIRNMSHEIRTPLNAINGFSELIANDSITTDEKQAFSRIIFENCYHLTSMLNNLLEIAQLDGSNDSLPLVPTRIHELCVQEMEQMKKFQEKPEIRYSVIGDKDNDMILTNRTYFGLVLSHLLANANKFTEKGSIELSYKLDNAKNIATITVTDTGCGIPEDKQEWIFERFTKANDFVPGSGLGLYLCRLILNRLHGKIKTDLAYTEGARLIITMPIAIPTETAGGNN